MATSEQKKVIALLHLGGASVKQLAEQFEYTYGGMLGLLKSKQIKEFMGEAGHLVQMNAGIAKFKFYEALPEIARNLVEIATDPSHKNNAQIGMYIMDKVGHVGEAVEETSEVVLKGKAADHLTSVLLDMQGKLRHIKTIDISHRILEGDDAVPRPINQEAEDKALRELEAE